MNSFFTIKKEKHGQSICLRFLRCISMSDGKLRLAAFPFSASAYTLRGFLKKAFTNSFRGNRSEGKVDD